MRAGLFLEGLARSHSVHVLVAPVLLDEPPPEDFVPRHAVSLAKLELDPAPDAVADLTARLGTPADRSRVAVLHPLPALCRQTTPAAADAVAAAAEDLAAVHVLRIYLAPLLDTVLERSDCSQRPRLTLDVDDFESATHRRLGELEEAERYERLEAHYLPLLDHVIATSRADADALAERHGLSRVTAVPNATRPPQARSTVAPVAGHDLILVGNLSYAPNVEAARWLCEDVLPLLGDATVALVGSRPVGSVRALAGERVTVAPDVPDVAPWYAGAGVAVAPLRAGGGSRTKVIEAFAHRRPVVTTSIGAEGLELTGPDGPALVADNAEAFAAACRRLLNDPELAARLASRGEAAVRATATVDLVAEQIDAIFTGEG